jgi:glycine hydroxymethyltransferase
MVFRLRIVAALSRQDRHDYDTRMTTTTSTTAFVPDTLDDVSQAFLHHLWQTDPEAAGILADEAERQASTIELIASENHVTPAVMHTIGTWMTNKYAEGYPGKRYYSGCVNHDRIEQLAIDRACELFGCEYANVQPHSGANANLAMYYGLLEPGDTFMSVVLSDGGHLTHGSPVSISGKWLKPVHYPLVYDEAAANYGHLDYDQVEAMAKEHKPKIIMCGYSAYPRIIDFAASSAPSPTPWMQSSSPISPTSRASWRAGRIPRRSPTATS